jgi:hypothetical protein
MTTPPEKITNPQELLNLLIGPSSTMDSSLPSDSAKSTNPDSSSLRNDSNFLNKENSNEQPPTLEPITETSCDPEEGEELIMVWPLATQDDLHALNDHQRKKFSKLRRRVRRTETICVTATEGVYLANKRNKTHARAFYFVGAIWALSMWFISYKISTISS